MHSQRKISCDMQTITIESEAIQLSRSAVEWTYLKEVPVLSK
jgi:hypothetical protein